MRLSNEALEHLCCILVGLGYGAEVESASREDLEGLGLFLLNLTAAAIKTRSRLRMTGEEVPPSTFPEEEPLPRQGRLPGFD